MAVYWPNNSPYLPPQSDPASNRRVGVAASPPAAALLRPGYPPVTLPPNPRYVVPSPYYVRQPQQAEPRNPRQTLRPPYHTFINQDGVQMLGTSSPLLVHPAALPSIAAAAPEAAHQPKRPRMEARAGTGAPTAPLTIDTKESTGYQPQVEAISPTPEDRPAERDDIKSTKDDLLQKISKVDREIAKTESLIAKYKKKQEELEEAAKKPSTDSATDDEKPNQSIAQNVYSENRRKALQSAASLNQFSPGNLLPLYNQPSDTELYNKNKKEYTVFKKKLVEYFKKKNEENERRDRYMTVTYCKLTSEWTRKVARAEASKKRKEREGKSREMYEKMFPELRKQREDKDRNERLGTRGTVRSDQEFQDVIDRIQEHELEEKKMHSYAVIPPPLLPPEERRRKFTNNNGLVQDPLHVYNERKFVNMWTDAEKETFREKYLQHPKNFFMIAQYLERKTVSDCVQYYYLSKKTENYKQLLRKSRPRGGARRRPNNPTGEVIAPNLSGVVTRRTVQELQEKEGESGKVGSRSGTPQPASVKQADKEAADESEKDGKGKKERNASKKVDNESSDEEDANQPVKSAPHPCVVCKSTVESSRAVPKERAGQLGLVQEELDESSRVCNNCWCKTLARKCPLLSCSTSSKGKKLRHMPTKWKELPANTKETLAAEMQIPEGTKQVCITCFGRINKRISQLEADGAGADASKSEKEPHEVAAAWADAEVELLRLGLRTHGNNWAKISPSLPEKTPAQCKEYFYSMRKKLQLDKIVQEYKKANRPQGSEKPSLSSDEESGSSTSSAEEDNARNKADNKEAGPSGLAPPPPRPAEEKASTTTTGKEEAGGPAQAARKAEETGYDSAATVSADESQEMERRAAAAAAAAAMAATKSFPTIPTPLQMSKTISVQDIMNNVIDKSLVRPFNNTPRTSEILTIKDLLPADPAVVASASVAAAAASITPAHPGYIKATLPPPELEVRPINASQAPPALVEDGGVLNLTVNKRSRSPPPPSQSGSAPPPPSHQPPESVYRPSYIHESLRGAPRGGHTSVGPGEKPPAAHASSKTTHKESMNQDNLLLKNYEKMNASPQMIPRADPRHKMSAHPSASLLTGPLQGSITRGQPIPQPQHQGSAAGASGSGRYDHSQQKSLQAPPRGSISTGTPVYTDRRNIYGEPSSRAGGLATPVGLDSLHKKPAAAPYPFMPQTGGHELRGNSSRSVIENDYRMAQSLPRKDSADELRGAAAAAAATHYRGIDPRGREVQIVDAVSRFDSRPVYPTQSRGPYSNIRTDPKADIPPRDQGGRGVDPTIVDVHDPRHGLDARGRPTYPAYLSNMRDPGRRSPPRSLAPSRPPSMAPTHPRGSGSISAGLPRSSVEIQPVPRQPEVSITKQPAAPAPRSDYPHSQLQSFAEIAVAQPKVREGVNPSALTVTRTDGGPSRLPPDLGRNQQRLTEDRNREIIRAISNLSDQERRKYIETFNKGVVSNEHANPALTTKNIIDLIVTSQINNMHGTANPSGAAAAAAASAAFAIKGNRSELTGASLSQPPPAVHSAASMISQVSPSKQATGGPSRSPSVKTAADLTDDRAASLMVRTTQPGGSSTSLGEHLDNMIKKEVQKNRTSPFPGVQSQAEAVEYWKRKQYTDPAYTARPPSQGSLPRPPSGGVAQLGSDERQIIRVAQNASPHHPEKPPSRSMMESVSPTSADPARSTPNYASYQSADNMARFLAAQRKPHEVDPAAAKSSGAVFDYVKTKIAEAMKNDKPGGGGNVGADPSKTGSSGGPQPSGSASGSASMGPPSNKRQLENESRSSPVGELGGGSGGGPPAVESPRKRYKHDDQPGGGGGAAELPDSPGSGEMVIDESARPDSAHSHKTASPAPNSADPGAYPSYRQQQPPSQSLPPRSSPGQPPRQPPPTTNAAPAAAAASRYEPLSDDD